MLDSDFDPLQLLHDLQRIQVEQAENLVKVSEWMMSVSTASTAQSTQLDHLFKMITALNKQIQLLEQRCVLLENHLIASINNTSSKDQVPDWDL